MKYTKIQTYLIIIGLAFLISNSIVLYLIFLEAYFNDFIAVFEINRLGEAYPEFVLMPITLILGFYASHLIVKDLRDRRYESKQKNSPQ